MKLVKILVDSFADDGLTNAQMINAREIVSRLSPDRFSVTMFVHGPPARQITGRPNTRLIQLPDRLQTIPVLAQVPVRRAGHSVLSEGIARQPVYVKLRSLCRSHDVIAGTIESQTDWRDETINPHTIRLLEQTVLRCDYLFSNSAFVKRSLETNYSLPSEVVPTGVDTDFFTPNWERPANSRPRVLFVERFEFKGPQVVLDAAERYPQADFVLVGDGVMAQKNYATVQKACQTLSCVARWIEPRFVRNIAGQTSFCFLLAGKDRPEFCWRRRPAVCL